jgi:hypothetical protein
MYCIGIREYYLALFPWLNPGGVSIFIIVLHTLFVHAIG